MGKTMKRINLNKIMNETSMAMLTDAENYYFYHLANLYMPSNDYKDKIVTTTVSFHVESSRETMESTCEMLITLMTYLNQALNRSIGAPEGTKFFKILETKMRYLGNQTAEIKFELATVVCGTNSVIHTLLSFSNMQINLWNTKSPVFYETNMKLSNQTHGLGNGLKSWNAAMKRNGQIEAIQKPIPNILINYIQ